MNQDTKLYYTAPSDTLFEDCRKNAIKIWKSYDNTYGYASEKIDQIKDIKNIKDNFMYIVAMFDTDNQAKLFSMVMPETKQEILKRLPKAYREYYGGENI